MSSYRHIDISSIIYETKGLCHLVLTQPLC